MVRFHSRDPAFSLGNDLLLVSLVAEVCEDKSHHAFLVAYHSPPAYLRIIDWSFTKRYKRREV